jgi:hypothetical protein
MKGKYVISALVTVGIIWYLFKKDDYLTNDLLNPTVNLPPAYVPPIVDFPPPTVEKTTTWQAEVFSKKTKMFSGIMIPTRIEYVYGSSSSLYQRMAANPSITISGMTAEELGAFLADLKAQMTARESDIGYGYSMGESSRPSVNVPNDLKGLITVWFWGATPNWKPDSRVQGQIDTLYKLITEGR